LESLENSIGLWRFGVFEVDAANEELRRNGVKVKIREQSFRVLVYLLQHAGELVSREALRQVLWPADTFVDFDHSLNTAMMKLRDALGDATGAPVYIETIPKRGYRFIAPVPDLLNRSPRPHNLLQRFRLCQ
jgi:DNA-binding winged helix-turn-helix (wHTH) protein